MSNYRKLTSFTQGNSSLIFHEDRISGNLSKSFSFLAPSNDAEHSVTWSSVKPQYSQLLGSGDFGLTTGRGFLDTDNGDGKFFKIESSAESSDNSAVKSTTRSLNGHIFLRGRRGATLKMQHLTSNPKQIK